METTRICKECRQPLPADAPEGLCPACLAKVALSTEPAAGATIKLNLADATDEAAGQTLGRYKLLEKIGEGGCGVVYVALQTEPVRRRVALKIIKLGMDTKQVIARFEAERQALALMDHPNIAKIFDAGATETGRPYFVMELVKGVPITRYCDENNLSTATRLGLFIQVCQAIQHAHQKGIIHRDIKPSNVLLADHDGVPVPKIIDFGIAKATTDQPLTDKTLFTAFEQFIGTPAYMSPEQARLSGLDIDTRSDIYSLGVLLYELLTGKTPFEGKRLHEAGLDEIRRIIREEEPARPSTRLHTLDAAEQTTVAKHRQSDPPKLAHLISGDLDWIVMKALEKDRSRRYETANGLAMDIQRHLHNEPVAARPPSSFYRVQRMVRRNKLAFTTAGVVAAALIAGLGLSTWAWLLERQTSAHEQRLLYGADLYLAQQAFEQNNLPRVNELLRETKDFPDRGFEWYYWERQTHLPLRTIHANLGSLGNVAYSPDGRRIVAGSYGATDKVWDAASGKELFAFTANMQTATPGPNLVAAYSPDGLRIVTGTSWGGGGKVWDANTGRELLKFGGQNDTVTGVAFSPDGRRILTGQTDAKVRLWDATTGQELLTLGGQSGDVLSVAFSPDGRKFLTVSQYSSTVQIWDATNGRPLLALTGNPPPNGAAAFFPDGKRIVTGIFSGGTAAIWDATSGQQLLKIGDYRDNITAVAVSPDGKRILTGCSGNIARLWDATSGKELLTLKGHSGQISSLAFSPDGQRMITASYDGTIKIWDETCTPEPLTFKGDSRAFCRDGQRIIIGGFGTSAKVWDAATGRELPALEGYEGWIQDAAASRDGQRIVAVSGGVNTSKGDHNATLWDGITGRKLLTLDGHSNMLSSVAISPDGTRIVTCCTNNTAKVWNADGGLELFNLAGHTGQISSVVFSHDGRWIVTGSWDWTAKIWDAATGRLLSTLDEQAKSGRFRNSTPVNAVAISPDSRLILIANYDTSAKLWDVAGGRVIQTFQGHNSSILSVAFSPDGRRILTGSADQTAKLWDAVSGRELLTFENGAVSSVAFSPDGQRIVAGSMNATAKVWEAATPEQAARWQAEEEAAEPRHLVTHGLHWSWH